ncbi:MAG: methionine biosynthesis protein MetW [Planctomycetota bacterium]|jgi:methionine biosynthesis protein MetW|nr:methionine biosynthesis protein MetW [Planctomycetota bacterium]
MVDGNAGRKQVAGKFASFQELLAAKADPALVELLLKGGKDILESVGSTSPITTRGNPHWQHPIIAAEIQDGASILDLGCGEGGLLAWLADEKGARVQGVELDADKVAACVEKGIPVIQTDLDLGLKVFPDKLFDYVILEETLQTLRHPDIIIAEMRRVGRRGIVTFPNFGFWRVRLDLAVRGRMPVTGWLPHRWFQTPNIHLFSLQDFMDYAEEAGLWIIGVHVLESGESRSFRCGDNLYAEEAMVIFE